MDFELIIDNIDTKIRPSKPIERSFLLALEKHLSYETSTYDMYKKQNIITEYTLLDRTNLTYPTGLYSSVAGFLEGKGLSYSVIDLRKKPEASKPLEIHGKKLRDYQQEAVDKAIKAQRGIIKIATGGGKTLVAAAITARLNLNTLIVVNSLDLLEQLADEFEEVLKVKVGKIGGGMCQIEKFNVCTIQTLFRVLDLKLEFADDELKIKEKTSEKVLKRKKDILQFVENTNVIIIDECHHCRAKSYVDLMKSAKEMYFKFGLSGTPYNLMGTDIIIDAYSGKQIIDISASYLIERGFLVPPKIYILDPNLLSKYKYEHGMFNTIYDKWIVHNEMRNNLIVECAQNLLEKNKTILITVTKIEHGEIICSLLEKKIKEVKYAFIRGEVGKDERKKLLNAIRKRELQILVGTSVADEGINISSLDGAILAGGGKSMIKSLQRVGRTLRPAEGKTEAIIVDFYDHLRFLTSQSEKRISIYKKEKGFKVFEGLKKLP